MTFYEDLNKEHKLIVDGYIGAICEIENILTNGCLGESLIGHFLSTEGNEKTAEEFKDELVNFMHAGMHDLIDHLADMEAEKEG